MNRDLDHYEAYYAGKLWSVLPAVYRAEDTDSFTGSGPLREISNRIGAQAAILRRSIDRMWEDQSIDTCDDWVIAYIGDLLATNLVANLDARGQRLDVAKTIYYRRRKGTLAILEEIAADITGWDAKLVEFFRRLARTRHGLDPAIGVPGTKNDDIAKLQLAEGLVGPFTRTGIGGLADLRNAYGASKTGSAFDEFFYIADFRRGRGQVGWHNIPRLGVFLWRLKSFGPEPSSPAGLTTPVAVKDCPGWFTFDPTGRDIPLFARASRKAEAYGSNWVPPVEAQLPTPISQALFDENEKLLLYGEMGSRSPPTSPAERDGNERLLLDDEGVQLYPDSLSILGTATPSTDAGVLPASLFKIRPSQGRFAYLGSPPVTSPPAGIWVKYHYGFSSEVGAGPYDRRLGRKAPPAPGPPKRVSGGGSLTDANAVPPSGTLTLGDSLTYTFGDPVTGAGANHTSPVQGQLTIRAESKQRPLIRLPQFPGDPSFEWIVAGDPGSCVVLDGLFVSGGDIVLSGDFKCVTLTCCTLDPGTAGTPGLAASSPPAIYAVAADGRALASTRLWIEGIVGTLTVERCIVGPIHTRIGGKVETLTITDSIIQAIPTGIPIGSPPGASSPDASPPGAMPPPLPADAALALADGDVYLSRCTVMGPVFVHGLNASESILQDLVQVDDIQHGCVRFTAWASGSALPRQYESVQIPPGAPLFASIDFGQPAYGQLLPTADAAILAAGGPGAPQQNTISEGAEDGSEMGAFAREKNPVKVRSLLIKYQEFMPAGLIPVLIYAT